MKKLISMLVLTCVLYAQAAKPVQAGTWLACNTAGKLVPTQTVAGEAVALPLPTSKSRPSFVAFLTTPTGGSIVGKTITATLRITATPNVIYKSGCCSDSDIPTIRLYFTVATGSFNFNDSDVRNQLNYWWSTYAAVACVNADNGVDVTISAVVDPNVSWSASHGQHTSNYPAEFLQAAFNASQVGFALASDHFYDTGIGVGDISRNTPSGSATVHILSFTVQ